jgi:hypothetical protein
MRKPILNVWIRLMVVLTGVWMAAGTATFYFRELNEWHSGTNFNYQMCMRESGRTLSVALADRCASDMARSHQALNDARAEFFWGSAGMAAILAVIGWLLTGLTYLAARWILAGRRSEVAHEGK